MFFNHRIKKIEIGNIFLKSLPIFSGVPQVGVIDPLLFIICLNNKLPKLMLAAPLTSSQTTQKTLAVVTQIYKVFT